MITLDELEIPGIRHAFYGRRGGVSGGLYTSLNCGLGSGDDREKVTANRKRTMAALDLPDEALVTCYQHHSIDVVTVNETWAPDAAPKADALVTAAPTIAIGVLTADCAPVLFADPDAKVIGAAHAGWKGAKGGVVEATVRAMIELGARPSNIIAAIGPCIGVESYEVGPEFPMPFLEEDRSNALFFSAGKQDGKYMFDLGGYVARRLNQLKLGEVLRLDRDTCGDSANFFSYRRACLKGEKDYGRALAVIALA
ncbi:MAG: peptidoglycan editing factor PgeF [Alphaproteobacteria bacterium]|nr:peptidoglycan editing factor PgeF [Alphaproteobacteria bacterium]MBU0797393.1 peptidoglycan editing factor PgeF [Alphaproteobacteria bacterium]MBU0888091.1 peptidoglycan editing factor PgeF [Alphaproteobacteria bacterium]MBU1811536.1 peptidoglycan editing factor PgeF [Alphaproteobacteria bacterium]